RAHRERQILDHPGRRLTPLPLREALAELTHLEKRCGGHGRQLSIMDWSGGRQRISSASSVFISRLAACTSSVAGTIAANTLGGPNLRARVGTRNQSRGLEEISSAMTAAGIA